MSGTLDTHKGKTIRFALAGLGRIGLRHAELIDATPGFELVAVADGDEQARARLLAGRSSPLPHAPVASFEALLAIPADWVVIATPSHLHDDMTRQALLAGRHVMVEKPMASHAQVARELADLAASRGLMLTVNQSIRYQVDTLKVGQIIRSGELGQVLSLYRAQHVDKGRDDWQQWTRFGGGALANWGTHFIDTLLMMMDGPPSAVFARLGRALSGGDAEDWFKVVLRTESGQLAEAELLPARMGKAMWHVVGTQGTLIIEDDLPRPMMHVRRFDGQDRSEVIDFVADGDNTERHYHDLAAHLLRGQSPPISVESIVRQLAVLDAARQSDRLARELPVDVMSFPLTNEDESKVLPYVLPDPLVRRSTRRVADAREWAMERRPELLELFSAHVYGRTPQQALEITPQVLEEDGDALDGLARRRQVRLWFGPSQAASRSLASPHVDVLMVLPAQHAGPVGAFLGLNFLGNHTVSDDPAIVLPAGWTDRRPGPHPEQVDGANRGVRASRWPVELIVSSGYALVTACYNHFDPDYDDGFHNGVHPLLDRFDGPRPADAWGAIGAWAWGLSRILDHLAHEPAIDASRVAVMGHSRLGKAALWAGAQDERFAMVISNNSGCGGASLSRRNFGETIAHLMTAVPYWVAPRLAHHGWGKEHTLPVDQHELLALCAPRPVYVASATQDLWADPHGEFLACVHASPVYEFLGLPGLGTDRQPAPDAPVSGGRVGYHLRTGRHDVTAWDWRQFIAFADRHGLGGVRASAGRQPVQAV